MPKKGFKIKKQAFSSGKSEVNKGKPGSKNQILWRNLQTTTEI